jgi:hypothetical protein
MKGNLPDSQAAKRARQSGTSDRYQVRRDGEKYMVVDTETLLCFSSSIREAGAIKKAKRLNYEMFRRQIFPDEDTIPKPTPAPKLPKPRYAPKKKSRSEPHGTRWSKFGIANADTQSLMQSSIPRWGFKIKTRSEPEDK